MRIYVENGTLKITAIRKTMHPTRERLSFTSARLNSKFTFRYGKVVCAKPKPKFDGTWPIWTLCKDF